MKQKLLFVCLLFFSIILLCGCTNHYQELLSSTNQQPSNYTEPAPKYSGNITVEFGSCVDSVDPYGNHVYRVDMKGEVHASSGARITFSNNPSTGTTATECPAWTPFPSEIGCERDIDQSESTTWTHVIKDMSPSAIKVLGNTVTVTVVLYIIDDSIAQGYRSVLDVKDYEITCIMK